MMAKTTIHPGSGNVDPKERHRAYTFALRSLQSINMFIPNVVKAASTGHFNGIENTVNAEKISAACAGNNGPFFIAKSAQNPLKSWPENQG